MTYLLDTDHVSILERRAGSDYAALVANLNLHPDTDVGVSVVSFHEQALGCNCLISRAGSPGALVRGYDLLFRVIDEFRRFPLVPFDLAAAIELGNLKGLKIRIGEMDLRIAAIALSRNLTLVTRNVSDFGKVPGLRTEDWTK
jgi:tRNA(fMet)-specific endonuclease VapC